jgi:hypothetical protein
MPADRSVAISAKPTLIWIDANNIDASIAYTETGSTPNMPAIVNPGTGEINLRNMPVANGFGSRVIITLTIDTTNLKNQNGTMMPPGSGRWGLNSEGYYQNPPTVPPTSGAIWFCANPAAGTAKDATPIQLPYASCARISDTQVAITLDTHGVRNGTNFKFQFCLGLVLPGQSNYYITIDPTIKGTGTGTSPLDGVELYEGDDLDD